MPRKSNKVKTLEEFKEFLGVELLSDMLQYSVSSDSDSYLNAGKDSKNEDIKNEGIQSTSEVRMTS